MKRTSGSPFCTQGREKNSSKGSEVGFADLLRQLGDPWPGLSGGQCAGWGLTRIISATEARLRQFGGLDISGEGFAARYLRMDCKCPILPERAVRSMSDVLCVWYNMVGPMDSVLITRPFSQ